MISVILPFYNNELTLKKCIDSILNQSFFDYELIIINDGSKDNSEQIINEYKDSRIKYYKQENKGVSAARNLGIKKSSGYYIFFIDADDEIEKDLLKELNEFITENNLDIVCSNIKSINHLNKGYNKYSKSFVCKNEKDIIKYFNDISIYMVVGKLFNKKFLSQNNIIFDEKMNMSEDFCFVGECLNLTTNIGKISDSSYITKNTNPFSLSKIYIKDIEYDITQQLNIWNNLKIKYPEIENKYAENDLDFKLHKVKEYADNLYKKCSDISFRKSIKYLNKFIKENNYLYIDNISKNIYKSNFRKLEHIILKTKSAYIIGGFYYLKHKVLKRHYL